MVNFISSFAVQNATENKVDSQLNPRESVLWRLVAGSLSVPSSCSAGWPLRLLATSHHPHRAAACF